MCVPFLMTLLRVSCCGLDCARAHCAVLCGAVSHGGETKVEAGVAITGTADAGVAAALDAVRWAEAVVLAVGTDTISVEHEGTDRQDVGLPASGLQHNFSLQVLAAAAASRTPVVLLLCNGGAVSIDTLMLSESSPAAIIEVNATVSLPRARAAAASERPPPIMRIALHCTAYGCVGVFPWLPWCRSDRSVISLSLQRIVSCARRRWSDFTETSSGQPQKQMS